MRYKLTDNPGKNVVAIAYTLLLTCISCTALLLERYEALTIIIVIWVSVVCVLIIEKNETERD